MGEAKSVAETAPAVIGTGCDRIPKDSWKRVKSRWYRAEKVSALERGAFCYPEEEEKR
jgi:hypothetical protein